MLLETRALSKKYRRGGGVFFYAADRVSLSVSAGETVGLLGKSGSGKSTVGQMIAGLVRPFSGEVCYKGTPLAYPYKGEVRRRIQILFQHPEASFNPVLPLEISMREPYRLMKKNWSKGDILQDLERFGLHEEHLYRTPGELSGGELQRAALSRVLVMEPELIVLDEPTSMLDVISQAQIVRFLMDYQKERGTAYLFITHHRKLAEQVCGRCYEMEEGRLA
ncbi:MAG: ABC transporter ATP-binding protein [Lachnospiraceae bacterium]|nr:ABC transporter ATP-binding protein [Lachnospiraceae bacterium]